MAKLDRVLARPYLMTLYVIFPIYLNFPICSRCILKAIVHRKKKWIVLPLLEKVFSFFKRMLFMIIVHAYQGCKQWPVNGNYRSYLHYHRPFCWDTDFLTFNFVWKLSLQTITVVSVHQLYHRCIRGVVTFHSMF